MDNVKGLTPYQLAEAIFQTSLNLPEDFLAQVADLKLAQGRSSALAVAKWCPAGPERPPL